MGVLVEDMLLLARLDQQRPLERRTVDMLTLAADAVNDARVVAPDRSINLTVGAGAALLVLGDEVRLRQVIGNLMSNALNHTPEGTPDRGPGPVRHPGGVAHRRGQRGPGRARGRGSRQLASPAVVFEVADRGPGLTPEQAEHVFERFYRADQAGPGGPAVPASAWPSWPRWSARTAGPCGSSPTPGGGATFRIAIPLAPEAACSAPEPEDSTDPGVTSPPALSGRPGRRTAPGARPPGGWPPGPGLSAGVPGPRE